MIFVRLFLNALGSCLMAWGLIAIGMLLILAIDWLIDRLTGKYEFFTGRVERWRLVLIPATATLVWYAGFAAYQVQLDSWSWQDSVAYSILVHTMAIVGLAIVVVMFDVMFRAKLEMYESLGGTIALGVAGVATYAGCFAFPVAAEWLGASWPRVLYVFSFFT